SPLEHLLECRDALERDMQTALRRHGDLLAGGDDCSPARAAIHKLFAMLSENALLLQEVYDREARHVSQALASFQAWDKKRSKVLARVQRIRSQNNQYGAKLAGLLARRSDIDAEIAALESRLGSLRASRLAVESEVGETMSVLESKSAKYVEMFRCLEKAGTDAVLDYLGADAPDQPGAVPLLRYESVDAMFAEPRNTAPGPDANAHLEDTASTVHRVPSPGRMGAQAFEVPDTGACDDGPERPAASGKEPHSAYERGFAKGSEQLHTVKRRLSLLLQNVIPAPEGLPRYSATQRPLGDMLNTITRKLDLLPIVDLLTSKSEAVKDLVSQASRASECFHRHGLVWAEVCKYLDVQEETLLLLIARSLDAREAEQLLDQLYVYLTKKLKEINTSPV
ncbi:hypothetical protein METBIDRAFT_19071, partial [Metschnikowia bicuspidata var. bicuspidata NRRL YB-4993]